MKRKAIAVLCILLILACVCSGGCSSRTKGHDIDSTPDFDELDSYGQDIKFLTIDVPTVIYSMGDEICYYCDGLMDYSEYGLSLVPTVNIDSISEQDMMPDDRAMHYAIVINDRNSTVSLSDEDVAAIKRLVDTTQYSFIYIGSRYGDLFQKYEMYPPGGSYGSFYVGFYLRQYTVLNDVVPDIMFSEEFIPSVPGETIVSTIAYHIKSCR